MSLAVYTAPSKGSGAVLPAKIAPKPIIPETTIERAAQALKRPYSSMADTEDLVSKEFTDLTASNLEEAMTGASAQGRLPAALSFAAKYLVKRRRYGGTDSPIEESLRPLVQAKLNHLGVDASLFPVSQEMLPLFQKVEEVTLTGFFPTTEATALLHKLPALRQITIEGDLSCWSFEQLRNFLQELPVIKCVIFKPSRFSLTAEELGCCLNSIPGKDVVLEVHLTGTFLEDPFPVYDLVKDLSKEVSIRLPDAHQKANVAIKRRLDNEKPIVFVHPSSMLPRRLNQKEPLRSRNYTIAHKALELILANSSGDNHHPFEKFYYDQGWICDSEARNWFTLGVLEWHLRQKTFAEKSKCQLAVEQRVYKFLSNVPAPVGLELREEHDLSRLPANQILSTINLPTLTKGNLAKYMAMLRQLTELTTLSIREELTDLSVKDLLSVFKAVPKLNALAFAPRNLLLSSEEVGSLLSSIPWVELLIDMSSPSHDPYNLAALLNGLNVCHLKRLILVFPFDRSTIDLSNPILLRLPSKVKVDVIGNGFDNNEIRQAFTVIRETETNAPSS